MRSLAMKTNQEKEAELNIGDKVFVRRPDQSFPVVISEIQGNWIFGIGTGSNPEYSRIEEWFPIRSLRCSVSKVIA